ncbi:hypothetical protein HMSP1_23 [Sinorhizobium phage HMSP1-Susan]|nr:hypothetical protein HMSP1_23 [Sinorhizobium phage HMSP1-Susan]
MVRGADVKIWELHGSWFAVTTNKGTTRREYIAYPEAHKIEIYDYSHADYYESREYLDEETFLTEFLNMRLNEEVTCRTIYA